jgi:hypothetical protein
MSPIYTGDKFGFGASTSAGGGGDIDVYNNAGLVFTNAGAFGNAGPTATMMEYEYKDQKFWTENHYFTYTDTGSNIYANGGFIFVRTPKTGTYTFEIRGAFGGQSPDWNSGNNKGGSPWYLKGEVDLVGGRWIGVLVGQKGGEVRDSVNSGGGGGGGTFLFELDGSESETSISKSYIESASVTCLLVAAGGNGANWQSWNSQDVPARDETSTGATDWILGAINSGNNWGYDIFGRGAFGGSFNYTPYSTVNVHNAAGADAPWYNNYDSTSGTEKRSGMPILDSSNKISHLSGLGGIHWNTSNYNQRYNQYNRDPNSSSHGAIGGFGGGAGGRLEGGGGGGYWGGAAWQENQYSTTYNYGAQSYVHPTRVTVESSKIYGDGGSGYGDTLCGLDMNCRCRRMESQPLGPHRETHGKLYLCPKAPKATAIGEAVFHADGHNIGETQNGVGKVTSYDWYVPEGVSNISVVTVGGGGGGMARHDGGSGGGGALAYKNNIAVTAGQKIKVQVGCGGFMRAQDVSNYSPKGTDSKILVYPATSGASNGGSLYLDGNSVAVAKAGSAASYFAIGANTAFCVEAWVNIFGMGSYNNIMSSWDSSGGYHNLLWSISPGGQIFFGGFGGSTYTSSASSPVTANNWHHVCVASNGSSVEFYIDGVMSGGFNNSNDNDNMTYGMYIGANMDGSGGSGNGSYRMNGQISNLRYVVGHKTYDSNFTPPTSPLTPTSQGVPAGKCKFLGCQDENDWTNTAVGGGISVQASSPYAVGTNPFGADSPTATKYATAGGGYGVYHSGQSCASSQNDVNKGKGGEIDGADSDGGGNGGNGMQYSGCRQGGGGAGGYAGGGLNSSGYPSNHNYSGCGGAGGNNGGAGGGAGANGSSDYYVGGGGGTGIYDAGTSGTRGDSNNNGSPDQALDFAGRGGSEKYGTGNIGYTSRYNASGGTYGGNFQADGTRGGMTGYNRWRNNYQTVTSSSDYKGPDGGFPGGGAGGGHGSDIWGMGGHGVVRIIWGQVGGSNRIFGNPGNGADLSTTYDSDADVFRIGSQPGY